MTETIVISGGGLRAELLPLGAALHRFEVQMDNGTWRNVVLSRADPSRNDMFQYGASIGRFANRIAGARITIDGIEYRLDPNEGEIQVHGGPVGFSDRLWLVVDRAPDSVVFRLISPDGDQGFPGELTVTAEFQVIDGGIRVVYSATTDAPTVINLTTHPYFILGGTTIDDHRVQVAASQYTPTTVDHLPTGEILPVDGTPLDLRDARVVRDVLADLAATGFERGGGINHSYVVDGTGLRLHASLVGPSGLAVDVFSDAPGVELYSLGGFGNRGLAIEPQDFPDAPNQPTFPSPVLRPGVTYRRTIEWRVR